MAVNFDARPSGARKASPDYKYSLSAIEDVWSNIASTKENLDNVDRRIRNAKNLYIDDLTGEPRIGRRQGMGKLVRKYGKRKSGNRVTIDPNPKIGYREDEELYSSENEDSRDEGAKEKFKRYVSTAHMAPKEPSLPKRSFFGDRYETATRDNIKNDFDYEPKGDILGTERPATPKIPKLDSSINRKILLSNIKDSGAIERIRQQIKQQKEHLSSPEMQALPSKPRHTEDDAVIVNDDKPKEPMKRKVASSSRAPSYKGFNMPEAKENVTEIIKMADNQQRKVATHKERKERVGTSHQKGRPAVKNVNQDKKIAKKEVKKSPGKMQRIMASRKPVPSITVSSWRVGQEAVKKVLQSMKYGGRQSSRQEKDENRSFSKKSSGSEDEEDLEDVPEDEGQSKESEIQTAERSEEQRSDPSSSDRTKQESHQSKTSEKSEEVLKEDSDTEDDLEKMNKDLLKNEELPDEAKSMLAELQMDPSDSEERDSPPKATSQGTVKSPIMKKRTKRKAPQTRRKQEEDKMNRAKIRHYDQEEIQSYMARQLAERKKKRLQEKKKQQQMKVEQEKKLKELYMKQKSSLRGSVTSRQSKTMGSTFTKQNKHEEKGQSSQDRHQPETLIKQLMKDGDVKFFDSISHRQDGESIGFPNSPPIGESSKREHVEEDEDDETVENDLEEQFKDSLEFDKFEVPGIKNITVKKAGSGSPIQAKPPAVNEPKDIRTLARSVENEVRELLEKYKASRPTESKARENRKAESKAANDLEDRSKLSKAERIAAIAATANTLRERLAIEADRLASLRMLANEKEPPASASPPFSATGQSTEFRGALPGTGSMHEQAKTNEEIASKVEAATKIQAAFRGHSIRQGLTWKLPSGKTFGASLREARQNSSDALNYKKKLETQPEPLAVDSYSTAFDADSDVALFSDRTTTESLIKEAKKTSKLKDRGKPKFKSLQNQASSSRQGCEDPLKGIFERIQGEKGDRYSVINVLVRRLKEANKNELEKGKTEAKISGKGDNVKDEAGYLSNEDLYEQDFEDGEYESLSSTIKSDLPDDGEGDDEQWTTVLTEKDSEALSDEVEEDPDKTLTLLPEDLHADEEPSVKVRTHRSDEEQSIRSVSDMMSPARSPVSLTEGSVDYEKEPVMSSTLRTGTVSHDERRHLNEQDSSMTTTNSVTEKFSPSALERKLRAEVNQLETMDDALRQVTDIERVRGVSLAQQETVSLAQILKARQLGYKQELEKLSKDATEQATRNAKEVDQAKAIATQASESVTKRLAEIRAEAAGVVAESAKKLEEVQKEAARRAEEAADKVEKAHKMATDVAMESANRYSNDIQSMATAAASAAASSAVQAAMQVHREQLEQLRNEALKKVSRSYTNSTYSSTSSRSETTESKTLTESKTDKKKSKGDGTSYADDDFEEPTFQKSSVIESLTREKTTSAEKSSNKSGRVSKDFTGSPTSVKTDENIDESMEESIQEDMNESKGDETIHSKTIESEIGKHSTPVGEINKQNTNFEDLLQQSEIEEQSFKIDDHITSSLTEDELDDGFRMVLPVVSHRRKSLEREKRTRRGKALSDNGTSSDDMNQTPKSVAKHGSHSPFAGEDTFNQFTYDLVRQCIQEEEVRSKHQRALLKLREKALIEKAKADMAWLEMQKSTLRNKGADDLMPPLNKKQRGLWLKLQSEQNEIRRLKQAYRAASHERRFMMYQQKEIVRLKDETQKIWNKLGHDKPVLVHDKKPGDVSENADKSISEASSIASVDQGTSVSYEAAALKSHSTSIPSKTQKSQSFNSKSKSLTPSKSLRQDSKSSNSTAEVPEDLASSAQQQTPVSKDASFPTYSGGDKTSPESQLESSKPDDREEGESTTDDVSVTEHTQSSMIVDLKKLKKKASEQYFIKREQALKERRIKFESIVKNQHEMANWQKRIELEEMRLKSDIKKALDKTRLKTRPSSHEKSTREEASESSESTIKSQTNSAASRTSSTKSILSKDKSSKSSESETSVIEDVKTASNETDNAISEESMLSGIAHKTSKTSIAEDYAEDTFDSPSTTKSKSKSISYYADTAVTSSAKTASKKKYLKDSDESKSEEDVSLADATSDASDVEKRIRQLEEELLKRRRDLDKIRKKKEKDQLRKQEQKLKQELQAVENQIQQENKENVNYDRSISESNSFIKAPVSPKIMSPKVLQPANQHDHLIKKQSRESRTTIDAKETRKSDQSSSDESMRGKRDAVLARQIANRVIEQVKEKTENKSSDDDVAIRSLSKEVDALKKLRSADDGISSRREENVNAGRREERRVDDDEEASILSCSAKEKSISESLSTEISTKSNESVVSVPEKEYSYSETGSSVSSKSKGSRSLLSQAKSLSSKSIGEELSKAAKSARSSHSSVVEEQTLDDRSDSLHSISESIFSDKSVEEEVESKSSQDRYVSIENDDKKEEEVDDIYNDDFFESSSSSKQLQSQGSKGARGKSIGSDIEEDIPSENRSTREEISSTRDISGRDESTKSDSKAKDSSAEEKLSQALSSYDGFLVNDRVVVDGALIGTIRYIGRVSFSPVAVAGIELDEKFGNTDGTFRNKRYFTCHPDHGLFSPVANISHLERKEDSERKGDVSKGKHDDSITDVPDESVKTDIEEEISVRSGVSDMSKGESQRSLSIRNQVEGEAQPLASLKERSVSDATISTGKKQSASSKISKEFSYKEDFEEEEEEESETEKELSYVDDFEDVSAKEDQRSVSRKDLSQHDSRKESTKGSISEHLSIKSDMDGEQSDGKEGHHLDELQVSFKDDRHLASPSTLSEVESSDAEAVPHPPRVNLDQLADSLTEGLLKKLLAESIEVTSSLVGEKGEEDISDNKGSPVTSLLPKSDEIQTRQTRNDRHDESANGISEEIIESISEKSGDTIKRMSGHNSSEDLDLEVSEAFITPTGSDILKPDEKQVSMPETHDEKGSLERLRDDQNRRPGLVEEVLKRDENAIELSPSAASITEKEIGNVSKALVLEAISQMMQIMKDKKVKLAKEKDEDVLRTGTPEEKQEEKQLEDDLPEARRAGPKEHLGDLPKLSTSPPKSPTDFDLEKPKSAIDTDLLAAKLNELKRMDQEIDVLLGEDSDEDEPFSPISKRVLPDDDDDDDETDILPPVRIYDFEPVIHVPNTQESIRNIVADSAKIVMARIASGEDYDDVAPDELFLQKDIERTDGNLENSSKMMFTKMIFDVTRDLLKEVEEFKNFQSVAQRPWTKQNRRVFAKFIRQIHNLSGVDLVESFQEHICVCLGLKNGRPSLESLKKRLPLNTSKKDYIDALLVEELREEEPRWVNYDEDEIRVKEQLTEGILESLISETVNILNDIQLKWTR